MIRALSFLALAILPAAMAEKDTDFKPYPSNKIYAEARIKLPNDVWDHDIGPSHMLEEIKEEELLYADEHYIVVRRNITAVVTAEDIRAKKKDEEQEVPNAGNADDEPEGNPEVQEAKQANHSESARKDEDAHDSVHVAEDDEDEITCTFQPEPATAPDSKDSVTETWTAFYDSRTFKPLFYLPFAANTVAFNTETGLFALSYDPLIISNTYRSPVVVLLDPVARQCSGMRFSGPAIGFDDYVMRWNGSTLEMRLGWGPMRPTYKLFRFEDSFLKKPVDVLSLETSDEEYPSYEEAQAMKQKKKERWDDLGLQLVPYNSEAFMLRPGKSPGGIVFTYGKDLLHHLDFDRLQFDTVAMPGFTFLDAGSAAEGALWIYATSPAERYFLTQLKNTGVQSRCECPGLLSFLPDGSAAWDCEYVYDIRPEGLVVRFQAPTDHTVIGLDTANREIYVQREPYDRMEHVVDYEKWRENMFPAAYDWSTGQLKTPRCRWFNPGEPSGGGISNEGCTVGIAPEGWRLAAHHDFYRRVDGLESLLTLRLPSGKCAHFNAFTADIMSALYRCGTSDWFLLLFHGCKGGEALLLNRETMRQRSVATWSGEYPPLWLPGKNWLFVPKAGFYEVVRIDSRGKVTPAFRFFPARGGYAIVLPNGLYAGTPGCEQLLQFRDEPDGLRRLAPWRNRPETVLKALGGNRDSIRRLKASTRQRLKQARVNTDKPEPSFEGLPRVTIARLPDLFAKPDEQRIVTATFTATKRPITSLVKSENGVIAKTPLEAPVSAGQSAAKEVRVSIAPGTNWIELRAVDADGVEGEPFRFRIIGRYSCEDAEGATAPGGAARSLFNAPLFSKWRSQSPAQK